MSILDSNLWEEHPLLVIALITVLNVYLLSVVLLISLAARRFVRSRYRVKKETLFRDQIEDYLFGSEATPQFQVKSKFDFTILRSILLKNIQALSGQEKAKLIVLYENSGLLRNDLERLKSRRWWVRLKALSHIWIAGSSKQNEALKSLLNDPNDSVSLSAFRILSQDADNLSLELLQKIIRKSPGRRYLLSSALTRLAEKEGAQSLLTLMQSALPEKVLLLCVQILGQIQATEALPYLASLFDKSYEKDAEVVESILETIRKIGDPQAIGAVVKAFSHPMSRVRAKAIEAAWDLSREEIYKRLNDFERDGSAEVRRALEKIHFEVRKAA